ncbi:MAG: hypothetical protein K0Q74_48 [Gammaproteobacteria bacterium]|jgi:hypothetical protein|nr:hypothetical protein [Gammaproteobacteria bacterium]
MCWLLELSMVKKNKAYESESYRPLLKKPLLSSFSPLWEKVADRPDGHPQPITYLAKSI